VLDNKAFFFNGEGLKSWELCFSPRRGFVRAGQTATGHKRKCSFLRTEKVLNGWNSLRHRPGPPTGGGKAGGQYKP